ncbi:FmdB family zinc ribbon protein [Calidifontibacter terrae]
MPTYAYACRNCHHQFEIVQSFTDESLSTCPECNGSLRKVFNSVGVVFKGSGFYRTDSRNGSTATSPAAPAAGAKSETSSSPSTDSSSKSSSADSSSSSSSSGSTGSAGSSGSSGSSSSSSSSDKKA